MGLGFGVFWVGILYQLYEGLGFASTSQVRETLSPGIPAALVGRVTNIGASETDKLCYSKQEEEQQQINFSSASAYVLAVKNGKHFHNCSLETGTDSKIGTKYCFKHSSVP